jgi:uncharacterized repeat protein (TIGR02543 family)
MKAYQMIAWLLALSCCLGVMVACNPSQKEENTTPTVTEPEESVPAAITLHYVVASGIAAATLKADIAKALNIAEGTAIEISGSYDLATSGKYTVTCTWGNQTAQVSVWIYANSVNVTVDGLPYSIGDEAHLNYKKAADSNNFTSCISITDSLGNALKVTKDKKSMRFENREGLYVVYYKATDAAGQEFTVRVLYDVTYEHYISVANGPALIFEESASFSADFDGATDVWLEDSNGKIDPALYEIQENAVVLKKAYYEAAVGKRMAVKVCSDNGYSYFYATVYDMEGYDEYLKHSIEALISYQSSFATFEWTEEAPAGISFEYGYHYTKKAGPKVDQTALVFRPMGKYGTLSFDIYVKDSFNAAGNKDMELQLFGGAKFVSVVDADGNSLPIVDKNDKPHVVLTTGKTYHIVLNINEAPMFKFYVWGGRTVDLYYYNFVLGEPQYTYVLDDAKKSVVCYKGEEEYGYFAWPTVTKLGDGRLMAVSSGMRKAHIDIEGKLVGWFSEDEGKTWSEPQVLADTLLDDRDAGVVYWNGKIIVSWFCASKVYYINNNANAYGTWAAGIDDDYDTKYMGGNYIISEDGGKTWSEIYSMPEGMFTPHGLIVNPEGGLTSVGYLKYDKVNKKWGSGIAVRTTTGEMNENGFVWSDAIVIADPATQFDWDFQEPYGIYNDEGVLIVVMRADEGLYQCELYPGKNEFTMWRKIAMVQEAPAHMFRHSSGVLVMTYGYRGIYYDNGNYGGKAYAPNRKNDVLGVRARVSYDGGMNWSTEYILTTDGEITDLGYSSSVELSNGKILTVYYQRGENETKASIYQVVWELPERQTGEVTLTFVGGEAMNGKTDNGDGLFIGSVTGNVGEEIVLPANPTKAGFTFDGWCLDYAGTMPFTGTVYEKSVTLYAKWVKN